MTFALGITGGIGSGKSTACRILEELGARVFYADVEARRLMESDGGTREEVTAAFGLRSYLSDGSLDRKYLADLVFGDPEHLSRLNAIIHPRVHRGFRFAHERAVECGIPVLVHEAALIFESGGNAHLDGVAVVVAPDQLRIQRVMERDGVTEEQVRSRMRHQWRPEELKRRADWVIDNAGSEGELRRQVQAVYAAVTR